MTQLQILKLAREAALEDWNKWYDRLRQAPSSPFHKARYASAKETLGEIDALILEEEQKEAKA